MMDYYYLNSSGVAIDLARLDAELLETRLILRVVIESLEHIARADRVSTDDMGAYTALFKAAIGRGQDRLDAITPDPCYRR